jgi:hypothetical protein
MTSAAIDCRLFAVYPALSSEFPLNIKLFNPTLSQNPANSGKIKSRNISA